MKTLTTLVLFVGISLNTAAQDPAFSQFNFNKLYVNPALAGQNGGLTVSLNNHNHLIELPGSFNTYSAAADLFICDNYGVGFLAMQHEEGEVALTTTNFAFIGALIINDVSPPKFLRKVFKNRVFLPNNASLTQNLRFGGSFRHVQTRLDLRNARFSSQIDNINGFQFGQSYLTPVTPNLTSYWDSDVGIAYEKIEKERRFVTFGLSVSHLFPERDVSVQNIVTLQPTKLTAYYSGFYPTKMRYFKSFSPNLLITYQNGLFHTSLGGYLFGNMFKATKAQLSSGLYVGAFLQFTNYFEDFRDANFLTLAGGISGIQLKDEQGYVAFGYSFDISNRNLKLGTSHEFSVRFYFPKAGLFCDEALPCPAF